MLRNILCSILIVIGTFFTVFGQQDFTFKSMDLGYLNDYSVCYEVDIDQDGLLWIATEEGLLRYNSKQSFLYNEYQGLPKSFSGKIQNILVDAKNRKWVSSENLLAKLNQTKNEFIEVQRQTKEKGTYIYDIEEFENQLWLASFTGLDAIDLDNHSFKNSFLKNENIQFLTVAEDKLIIGTTKGSYYYSGKEAQPIKFTDEVITSSVKTKSAHFFGTRDGGLFLWSALDQKITLTKKFDFPILDLEVDKNGLIYAGIDGDGIYVLNDQSIPIRQYKSTMSGLNHIPIDGIYDLQISPENMMWVASFGGGMLQSKHNSEGIVIINKENAGTPKLNNEYVRAILKTSEGDIWFGTKDGISIHRKGGSIQHLSKLGGVGSRNNILCMLEKEDHIWVGTYGNGAFKLDKKSLSAVWYSIDQTDQRKITTDKVYSILEDKQKNIWFGGIGGNLCKISSGGTLKTYPIGQIRSLTEGPNGTVYGTGKQGAFSIEQDKVVPIDLLVDRSKFDYSTINCLAFYKDEIWFGTSGDGLIIYHQKNKSYKQLSMKDGMPSDVVQGIVVVKNEVWASTSRGLVKVSTEDRSKIALHVFDERDGFASATFNYGAIYLSGSKDLLLGTAQGAAIVDLDAIVTKKQNDNFHFEFIETLADKDAPKLIKMNAFGLENSKMNLAYWQNFIKINFVSISHQNPEKIRYSWLMEGVNDQWSLPQSLNEVSIANLAPGSYTFKVKLVQNGIIESEVHQLQINISPPWWRSNLAYLLYFLTLCGLLYAGYVFIKTYLNKQNLDEQIQFFNNITHELKTPLSILLSKLNSTTQTSSVDELKSTVHRMNTLFDQLLNFNQVSSKFYQNQKISKINIEEHFNTIISSFKEELDRKKITLNFENSVQQPYFHYKKDVLDKISYNLISNAVKYTGQNGNIQIKVKQGDQNKIILTVTDNGIGIPKDQQKDILKRYYRARNAVNSQEPGTGLGLIMVKNLLEIDGGSITFVSEKELGTAFTITMNDFAKDYISKEDKPITPDSPAERVIEVIENSDNPKILIVEDNDELRIDMVEQLSRHFTIIAARNGKEGYEKALSRMPDLIVTDLIMPEIDGMEMCRMLQKDENTVHIPLFMMTVLNDSSHKVESVKSGVNTFFNKPVDYPYLIAQIKHVLEYKERIKKEIMHKAEVDRSLQFKDEREASFIKQIEDFILEKVKDEEISVQDICKHIGMSRTTLYMRMKEIIDQSPQNFIIITKMNHARNLLLEGGHNIQEVAFMVGFNNPKYFSTSFKKQFGMSPTSFLKTLNPADNLNS